MVGIKLEYLKEFICLSKEKSFTSASQKLYMNQTTLSRHIAALEEKLGVVLLQRSTHHVELTPQGELVEKSFQHIVDEYERLLEQISLQKDGYEEVLRVGALMHSLETYIEPVYKKLEQTFSNAKISIVAKEGQELIKELLDQTLDICLIVKVHFEHEEFVRFHKVRKEKLCVMVLEDDPLCKYENISIRQLSERNFVYTKSNNDYMDIVNGMLAVYGVYPKSIYYSLQEHTITHVMKRENGVAIVMDQMRNNSPKFVRFLEIQEEGFDLELCWAYRIDRANSAILSFIRFMDQHQK